MKKTRNIILIVLAVCLLLICFAGCGARQPAAPQETTETQEEMSVNEKYENEIIQWMMNNEFFAIPGGDYFIISDVKKEPEEGKDIISSAEAENYIFVSELRCTSDELLDIANYFGVWAQKHNMKSTVTHFYLIPAGEEVTEKNYEKTIENMEKKFYVCTFEENGDYMVSIEKE